MEYLHIALETLVIIFLIVAIRQIGDLSNKLDPKKPDNPIRPENRHPNIMVEINQRFESLQLELSALKLKIWKMENPPKFKVTDSVTRIDMGTPHGDYIVSEIEVLNINIGWECTLISADGETKKEIPQAWLMLKTK